MSEPESSDGVRKLREMQSFMVQSAPTGSEFAANAPFAQVPPSAGEVTCGADLKLSLKDSFIPLINDAKSRLEGSGASS